MNNNSLNHVLYIKVTNSKNIKAAIKKEKVRLIKQIDKYLKKYKTKLNSEGFTSFKYFLIISQLTTLQQIEDDSIKQSQVINAGELWAKLYIKFLIKKYGKKYVKNNINTFFARETF